MLVMEAEYAALLPVLLLTAVGAMLPLLGAFRLRAGWLILIASLTIVGAGALNLAAMWDIPGLTDVLAPMVGVGQAPIISFGALEYTAFVALFQLVFLSIALIVVLGSNRYITGPHQGEYYALLLLSTVGMMLVAASRDLITLFVGFELSSFCTYVLAGFFKKRLDSSEAATKYFLVGGISSSLAIFGISMVYGLTGSTSFEALAGLWDDPLRLASGAATTVGQQLIDGRYTLGVFTWALLLAGFGFKIALVPFHNYAADVYEGAPSTVGGFVSAGAKHMGFAAIFKVFLLGMFAVKANWEMVAGILAILTMIVGNVSALQQTNIKRILAYSSIGQAGYILIALTVGSEYALAGGLFHILTYGFMQAGAFIALAAAGAWGVGEELADWKGMGRRAPFIAFAMTIFMLSFAGIPPLAGFASKFTLFSAAIQAGGWYVSLAWVGIAMSAVSLVYYWRVVRVMYVEEHDGRPVAPAPLSVLALGLGVAATLVLGLFPAIGYDLSFEAARSLFLAITP